MNRIVSGMAVLLLLCMAEKGKSQNSDMGPNLINNSYMYMLDGNKPTGFRTEGSIIIEAVHPYTKGFEGPYCPTAPAGAAASVDAATAASPYWFGVYNKGSRIWRGGLADGWHSYSDGHILKITGDGSKNENNMVIFPFETNIFSQTVRFRAWIKIVNADWVGFGNDAGYYYGQKNTGNFSVTKSVTDAAQDGWYFIDKTFTICSTTSLDNFAFSLGVSGQNIEVYLALPQLTPVDPTGWRSSITDVISREGITINPTTKNVGIGTYDTKGHKLAVAGSMVAEQVVVKLRDQWPDYVFDPTYSAMPLSKVETYVKQNGHLPDVPSEKELQEQGVDLVKMNATLLKKVEELTLHVIEQNKAITELKQVVKVQNKRIKKLEAVPK
ncbi:hypothetical protein [uncultured Acetobacteroides sp.]|uniref:hypothetical protein n=1 Tax=uncultured Acetobacteroides sp. TaxID=1760811 RepID=UPI0029F48C65|nr:hypothetical protein [uncultured Acetobacteroides sp.]